MMSRSTCAGLLVLALAPSPGASAAPGSTADRTGPGRLSLDAPIRTWDEGIPLGNGLTGGLLWGGDQTINLSLDRGDLWDERLPDIYHEADWNHATIRRLVAERNQAGMVRRFDAPYEQIPYPTKLPAGRLVMTLDPRQTVRRFDLDLSAAVGSVDLGSGRLEVFFAATEPVAMIRATGPEPALHALRPEGLDRLGYDPAERGREGEIAWMGQKAALGLEYAVVIGSRRRGERTELAVSIASTGDGPDPLAIGRTRVSGALERGFEALLAPHRRWWSGFWSISGVSVPEPAIQRQYDLVKYFYGAASRAHSPPMPLQGVWTRDDGGLPPWKGDYHHDLNTQMTYLPYHAAGLVDSGSSFLEFHWRLLPRYREFARSFYGVGGAVVPGVSTLGGKPTAGWAQYALSPINGLWVGQSFHLHWRHTMDRGFLETRAYPWLSEVATAVVELLEERDGKLYLPLSTSPEIHNNSMRAWLPPNSNHDLSLMRWAFGALGEMAAALGREEDSRRWRGLLDRLDPLDVEGESGSLTFARGGETYDTSHRHFSHTMAIHPLGTLTGEGTERERRIVAASVDRIHEKGTANWVGFSFSWFSCMLARTGRPELALRYLRDFVRAFILRNGFHVNGDQTGSGLSSFRYRPFTLEGNFLAMQAVHEMLLQSWGGRVRVFPAVSREWADVSFRNLRAEGGFRVSARRLNGRTVSVRIEATVEGRLRLRDPFDAEPVTWSRDDVRRTGEDWTVSMRPGEAVLASR